MEQAAQECGRLFTDLKRQGRLTQQVDLQTAAVALVLGKCTVVSKDTDFQAVSGLTVENWAVQKDK